MKKKTWEEVEHKFHPLWLTGLSSTGYSRPLDKEYQALARMKLHFSLLDDESDEVDLVEPRYYGILPKSLDLLIGFVIVGFLLYWIFLE